MHGINQNILTFIKKNLIGATFDDEYLYFNTYKVSLKPIVRLLERIPRSREFTRLPPLFDASENFPITEMYVELMVTRIHGMNEPALLQASRSIAQEQVNHYKKSREPHFNIHSCINRPQHHKIVILGDPGSGKTSLLKYLCLDIATGKNQRWFLPLFISLRKYWLEKQKNPHLTLLSFAVITLFECQELHLDQYHLSVAHSTTQDKIKLLEMLLSHITGDKKEHILFLLDGLDEVATNHDAIENISADIRQLGLSFAWVLTSRHTSFFGDIEEDICYEVVNLNKTGVEQLIENWFRNNQILYKETDKQFLLSQLEKNPRLKDMASNPFLLTLLCHIQQGDTDLHLPLHRTEVYAKIIQLIRLQLRTVKKNNTLFREQELTYLAKFCYYLYTKANRAPLQLFDYDHWDSFSLLETPPDFDTHFLSSRLLNSWRQGGDFHFLHLTFQEYLIALHIANTGLDIAKPYVFSPHWRMIFRFLAGIYSKQNQTNELRRLLLTLLDPLDELGVLYLEASNLLIEANIEDSTELLGYDIREKLWALWLKNNDYISNNAGELLATLSPTFTLQNISNLIASQQFTFDENDKTIKLLACMHSTQADSFLLELLQSTNQTLQYLAVNTLTEKNTAVSREAVIDLYLNDAPFFLETLCLMAQKSKHLCFLEYLTPYLKHKPNNTTNYNTIFQSLIALDTQHSINELVYFAQYYTDDNLPTLLIQAILAAQTPASQQWLMQKLTTQNIRLRQLLVYHATYYHLLTEQQLLDALSDDDLTNNCLDALLAQKILHLADSIIEKIVDTASQSSANGKKAFLLLENIPNYNVLKPVVVQKIDSLVKHYADHEALRLVQASINILGKLKTESAYLRLKTLCYNHTNYSLQQAIVSALLMYKDKKPFDVKQTLHKLYYQLHLTQNPIIMDVLLALAEFDLREILTYCHDQRTHNAMRTFCIREGILLFSDSYIDPLGNRHYFKPRPQLDSMVPAYKQIEALQLACRYLLDNNMAKKTRSKRGTPLPLFTKIQAGINENTFEDGVDIVTGNKFLKGEKISNASMETIMKRVRKIHPDFFTNG